MTTGSFSGDRLRWAREQLREHGRPVSQERLASRVGVSQRSIVRWENGQAPRSDVMPRLAEALARDVSFFYADGDAEQPGEAAVQTQMAVLVRELARVVSDALLQEVRQIIDQRLEESWTSGNRGRREVAPAGAGPRRPSRSSSSREAERSTR